MKKLFLLHLLFWGLFSSCATIFNKSSANLVITSNELAQITVEGGTPQKEYTVKEFENLMEAYRPDSSMQVFFPEVYRSPDPVKIHYDGGSVRHVISLDPVTADAYWLNIPFTAGLGLLIDEATRKTGKKYRYPYLDIQVGRDSIAYSSYLSKSRKRYFDRVVVPKNHIGAISLTGRQRQAAYDKYNYEGRTSLLLGVPVIYVLDQKFGVSQNAISRGMLGAIIGLETYHTQNRSILIDVVWQLNLIRLTRKLPTKPAGNTLSIGITDNYNWKRFSVGYGAGISNHYRKENGWELKKANGQFTDPDDRAESREVKYTNKHWSVGAILNGRWKMSPNTKMGVTYRPTFYRFGSASGSAYEHTISLDFLFFAELGQRR